jgi:hypothetical protein
VCAGAKDQGARTSHRSNRLTGQSRRRAWNARFILQRRAVVSDPFLSRTDTRREAGIAGIWEGGGSTRRRRSAVRTERTAHNREGKQRGFCSNEQDGRIADGNPDSRREHDRGCRPWLLFPYTSRSLPRVGRGVGAGLAGGYGTSRASARFESSEPWLRLAAGIGTGLAIAAAVSMVLYGIASVIALFVFESSGFNSY